MTLKLPEIAYPLAIDTIGKMLALGHGVCVHCGNPGCGQFGRHDRAVSASRRRSLLHGSRSRPAFPLQQIGEAGRDDKRIGFIHHVKI